MEPAFLNYWRSRRQAAAAEAPARAAQRAAMLEKIGLPDLPESEDDSMATTVASSSFDGGGSSLRTSTPKRSSTSTTNGYDPRVDKDSKRKSENPLDPIEAYKRLRAASASSTSSYPLSNGHFRTPVPPGPSRQPLYTSTPTSSTSSSSHNLSHHNRGPSWTTTAASGSVSASMIKDLGAFQMELKMKLSPKKHYEGRIAGPERRPMIEYRPKKSWTRTSSVDSTETTTSQHNNGPYIEEPESDPEENPPEDEISRIVPNGTSTPPPPDDSEDGIAIETAIANGHDSGQEDEDEDSDEIHPVSVRIFQDAKFLQSLVKEEVTLEESEFLSDDEEHPFRQLPGGDQKQPSLDGDGDLKSPEPEQQQDEANQNQSTSSTSDSQISSELSTTTTPNSTSDLAEESVQPASTETLSTAADDSSSRSQMSSDRRPSSTASLNESTKYPNTSTLESDLACTASSATTLSSASSAISPKTITASASTTSTSKISTLAATSISGAQVASTSSTPTAPSTTSPPLNAFAQYRRKKISLTRKSAGPETRLVSYAIDSSQELSQTTTCDQGITSSQESQTSSASGAAPPAKRRISRQTENETPLALLDRLTDDFRLIPEAELEYEDAVLPAADGGQEGQESGGGERPPSPEVVLKEPEAGQTRASKKTKKRKEKSTTTSPAKRKQISRESLKRRIFQNINSGSGASEIIRPVENSLANIYRRSKRNRVKPLNYWAGQRPLYKHEWDAKGNVVATLVGVTQEKMEPLKRGGGVDPTVVKKKLTRDKKNEVAELKMANILDLSIHNAKLAKRLATVDSEALADHEFVLAYEKIEFKESKNSRGIYTAIMRKVSNIAFGKLKFDPKAEKRKTKTGSYVTYFNVVYGTLLLRLEHEKPGTVVKTGYYFQVDKDTNYSIKNLREDNAMIDFTIVKEE